ncbi:hypothetical protein NIES4102_36160 [Chondrocystis sp. NIES-4102]|nr:hypothetical protein NIES4102_36160 [Chondrocystis sp. NIES-4102]
MLKGWLVGVCILFVLAEFSIWLKQFMLPLPIYILAGAFLAIASNYEQGLMALFRRPEPTTTEILSQTATLIEQAKNLPTHSPQGILPATADNSEVNV